MVDQKTIDYTIPAEILQQLPIVCYRDLDGFQEPQCGKLRKLWAQHLEESPFDNHILMWLFNPKRTFEEFFKTVIEKADVFPYREGNIEALIYADVRDPQTGQLKRTIHPDTIFRIIRAKGMGTNDLMQTTRSIGIALGLTYAAIQGINYVGSKYPLPADPPEPSLEERTAQRVRNAAAMLAGLQNGKLTVYDEDGYVTHDFSTAGKISADLEWLAKGAHNIQALDALLEQREKADAKLGKKEAYALAALTLHAQHYALTIKGLSELSEMDIAFQPIAPTTPYEPDIVSTSVLAEMYRQAKPEELVAIRKSLNKPRELLRQFCTAYEPVRNKLAAGKATRKELEPLLASIMNCAQGMDGGEMNRARESFDRIIARAHATRREPAPTPIGARTGASTTSPGNGTNGKPATAIGGND